MNDKPWWAVRDPEMAALTDTELLDYIRQWSGNLQRYREQAAGPTTPRKPGSYGPGYSAWWAGKILDRGVRERQRRRHRLLTRLATDLARLEHAKERTDADDR
jgi:hypothetical protein